MKKRFSFKLPQFCVFLEECLIFISKEELSIKGDNFISKLLVFSILIQWDNIPIDGYLLYILIHDMFKMVFLHFADQILRIYLLWFKEFLHFLNVIQTLERRQLLTSQINIFQCFLYVNLRSYFLLFNPSPQ